MLIKSMRLLIERFTTTGVARAARQLWLELKIQSLHRRAWRSARKYKGVSGLRLNIGCGPNCKKGWVNIDLSWQADLQLDLREALPFEDNSVAEIYSEHFLEHLEYPSEVRRFLQESWRVLQPGGVFSVGVPDCEWPVKSYAAGDDEWFAVSRKLWHPAWCNTRMHNLNYLFRQTGDHKYAYDFETLSQVLEQAGFTQITRRAYNPGQDSPERQWATLYVDACKPA
jgi:predicted SAM-dependent methyltransferase